MFSVRRPRADWEVEGGGGVPNGLPSPSRPPSPHLLVTGTAATALPTDSRAVTRTTNQRQGHHTMDTPAFTTLGCLGQLDTPAYTSFRYIGQMDTPALNSFRWFGNIDTPTFTSFSCLGHIDTPVSTSFWCLGHIDTPAFTSFRFGHIDTPTIHTATFYKCRVVLP